MNMTVIKLIHTLMIILTDQTIKLAPQDVLPTIILLEEDIEMII